MESTAAAAAAAATRTGTGGSIEADIVEKLAIYEGVITVLNREVEKLTLQVFTEQNHKALLIINVYVINLTNK